MKRVGIAELKAKLSENLRRVRRGERVLVEDRGTPIAEIRPIEAQPPRLNLRRAERPLATVAFSHAGRGQPYTEEDIERDRRGHRR